jgi:hypothetical protein
MGLFSGNRNTRNDTYLDQNGVNGDQYGNTGNHFSNHGNTVNDGRPSFSSYDQGNTYGNNNVNTNATDGHGNFGRDRNTGMTNQSNNINNTSGNHGVMNHDRNTGLTSHTSNTTGNQAYFHQNDGGALGQNANMNMAGQEGLSHHDRNVPVVDPNSNMNSNHIGHHGTSGYNDTSAYSKTGTGRGGWFSRRRNQDHGNPAHSQTGTGAAAGGGWFSRNRGAGFMNSSKRTRSHANRHQREKFDINSGRYNRRPSFGQWLKYDHLPCPSQSILTPIRFTWLDILTMVIFGAIGLGVYRAHPAPTRSFPVFFQDGEIVFPQFAYPLRHEIIPIWLAALLASIIPIFIILCMQFRIRESISSLLNYLR